MGSAITHPKTWTNQPDAVLSCEVIATFAVHTPDASSSVEIRSAVLDFGSVVYQDHRLVTFGNMLGSQTVRCKNDLAVYALLDRLSKDTGELPAGCEIVK